MEEQTRIDKDYIEAFNQGYELSKELGLKSDILKDLAAGNNRIKAMQDGMEEYAKEITQEKNIIPPLDFDQFDNFPSVDIDTDKEKDKGFEPEI